MVNDYMLDKVLDKDKKICTGKLLEKRILIDTYNKFWDDITFKNTLILMSCVVKDHDKF